MNQIRKRLTYANVMSSIAVFLVLGGATAFAASHLSKNSVGPKQLKKNAVRTSKIKGGAVTFKKLHKNSVRTAKVKNNAITGAKVNESTLGEVPLATTANNLAGQVPFLVRLSFGQSQTLATNGVVSFVAQCETGVRGTNDRARILAQTTEDGAALDGQTDLHGPTTFLDVATPEDRRVLVSTDITTGDRYVSGEIDQGFVMAPNGQMITTNSEGLALGLNYAGSNCLFAGVFNLVG